MKRFTKKKIINKSIILKKKVIASILRLTKNVNKDTQPFK